MCNCDRKLLDRRGASTNKVITTLLISLLTTAHILVNLRSLIWGFVHGITSLHSQHMCFKMCSVDIFVALQSFGCCLKGGLFDPVIWGSG